MLKSSYWLYFLFISCMQISIYAGEYQINQSSNNQTSSIDDAIAHLSQYDIWQTLQDDFIKISKEAIAGLNDDDFVEDSTNPFYENNETYLKRVFNNKSFDHNEWQKIIDHYYIIRRDALCKALNGIY